MLHLLPHGVTMHYNYFLKIYSEKQLLTGLFPLFRSRSVWMEEVLSTIYLTTVKLVGKDTSNNLSTLNPAFSSTPL